VSRLLKISILLNLVLIAYLIVILQRSRTTRVEVAPPAVKENAGAESRLVPTVTATALESKTFNWSQIESANYRTYIANLRGIGCPERTIRDIITADVDTIYAERREELRHRQQAQSKSALAESLSRRSLDSGLEELADEEKQLLKILLEPGSDVPTIPERVARLRIERMRQAPVSMPLVIQNVDLAELNLNEDQVTLITQLRENFVKEIGGYNQDPNDPAYRERWQKAQVESDELLHAMLGNRAYQDYQLLVPGKSPPVTSQP
jgi:hypothetical protein